MPARYCADCGRRTNSATGECPRCREQGEAAEIAPGARGSFQAGVIGRSWAWYRRQETRGKIGIGLLPLVGLVIIAASLGGGSSDNTTSRTPSAQSNTTRAPSLVDSSGSSSAVLRRYIDESTRISGGVATAFNTLATLTATPRVADPKWRSDVRAATADMKRLSSEVRTLNPPPCLQASYTELLKGSGLIEQAATQFDAGLSAASGTMIDAAGRLVADSAPYTRNAVTLAQQAKC